MIQKLSDEEMQNWTILHAKSRERENLWEIIYLSFFLAADADDAEARLSGTVFLHFYFVFVKISSLKV